jgi:hypothetical protein
MQSVTTALTWEYFARNRWSLLLVPLLSSAIALITLLPLRGVDLSGVPQRDVISIHLINVLCLVVAIVGCVMGTQGSMSQLYLKPLSNAAIVNYFFWSGALLVACQVALILWMWKIFFVSDWPIVGSVLFAVVCWGVFQPIFRCSFHSLSWVILAPAAFFILCFWLMAKHGIPVQRGGMLAPQVHYWDSISGSDGLIAVTTLCISYVLTVWRVNCDRSGRCRGAWTDRVREFFASIDARSASRIRFFDSPVQAQAWCDFQSRTASVVWPALSILPWFWLLAIIAGAISQALSPGLTFAVMGAYFAALLPIIAAFFVPLAHHLKQTVIQDFSSSEPNSRRNLLPLGMSPYLFSLPMSDRQRANAILRSSAWACGIASATILLSFAVPVGLSWVFGADLFMGKKQEPVKLGIFVPWFLVVVWGGSMLLSFVFSTLVCTLDVRKWNLRDGITPVILIAVLLASVTPIALPLSMLLCGIAAGYLVYAAIQALLREDISWVGASLVGLAGMASAAVLFLGMPSEMGSQGWVLGIILLMLAMLPFFTTAAAIRDLRTT